MLKIGEFARLARVSVRLLRHYDDIGLLQPSYTDASSGYRYYTLEQLPRLHQILALKDLGLSLNQITYLVEGNVSTDEIRGMLLMKQAELREKVEAEQARLARVEARLTQIERVSDLPQVDVVLKSLDPVPVLSLRRALESRETPAPLFRQIYAELRNQGLWPQVQAMLCLYYTRFLIERHVGLVPRRKLVEAAFVVPMELLDRPPVIGTRRMRAAVLPGYPLVATSIHCGSDMARGAAHAAVFQWIGAHGYQPAAPSREIYLRRGDAAHPDDHITEIQWPVERRTPPIE